MTGPKLGKKLESPFGQNLTKDRIVYAGTVYFQAKTVYFQLGPYTFRDRILSNTVYGILYFSGPYILQPNPNLGALSKIYGFS